MTSALDGTGAGRAVGGAAARQDPSAPAIPAIVFGSFVTGLGALRALGRLRVPAYAWAAKGELPALSRWFRPVPGPLQCDNAREASAELLQEILTKSSLDRAVLVPCTDLWVGAVARLPEPLASRFPASIAPRGALETLLDKGALSLLLAELGLPQPRTAVLRRPEDIDAFEPWSFADAFLKPRSSHHFMERFRVKGVRVASRAEAADRASALFRQGLDVIVQEYVPGPPSNHYFLDGFVDAAGAVRARFARKRLRMYPADFGNSTYMVSVPMDETGPAMGQLETLLRHVKYRGIFSAEFKKDARDGAFRLLEVNVRPWWYLGFAETSGIRVVDLAYRDALGLPLRDYLDYRPGRHCVYPYFDYAAYGAAKRAGAPGPSLAACAAAWLTANQPIFAWDDPGPALSSWKGLCQRLFKSHVLGQRP